MVGLQSMLGPFVPKVLTVCHLEQEPVNENESGVYVGENQRRCAAGRVEGECSRVGEARLGSAVLHAKPYGISDSSCYQIPNNSHDMIPQLGKFRV